VDLTPAQFAAKSQGFSDNLERLFKKAAGLDLEIRKQLAGMSFAR